MSNMVEMNMETTAEKVKRGKSHPQAGVRYLGEGEKRPTMVRDTLGVVILRNIVFLHSTS